MYAIRSYYANTKYTVTYTDDQGKDQVYEFSREITAADADATATGNAVLAELKKSPLADMFDMTAAAGAITMTAKTAGADQGKLLSRNNFV